MIYLFEVANPEGNSVDLPGLNLASTLVGTIVEVGIQIAQNPAVQQAALNLVTAGVNGIAAAINNWAAKKNGA